MQWFDNGYANGVDMAKFVRENASNPDMNVATGATQGDMKNEPSPDVDDIMKQTLLRLYQSSSSPGAAIVQEVVNSRLPELIKNLEHLVEDCDQRIRAMMEDIHSLAPNIERQNKSYANILDTIRNDLKDVGSIFIILESIIHPLSQARTVRAYTLVREAGYGPMQRLFKCLNSILPPNARRGDNFQGRYLDMVEVLYSHFYNNAIFEVRKEDTKATPSKTGVNQTDAPANARKGMFNALFRTCAKQ